MDNITFARTKGARDKRRRKRRGKRLNKLRKEISRGTKRAIDEQLRPFRGPSRKERIIGAVSTGAQLGLNLGVAAAVLTPVLKSNSQALKTQFGKISKSIKQKRSNYLARQKYKADTKAWIERTNPTPLNLPKKKK